ncbi:hypothetical protein GIB67_027833 [Kingdonia uniflora]|uniref:Potassium transporter n=1 Tax=Kingdonia uniflora TaxID=39325 RepID=A0A7J7P515_9MAGN|nr:hypothetical protein GIB67_027833 [Kingdonia uniflora]
MDFDCGKCWDSTKKASWKTTFLLAYQSLGVVYGDLSISPLYVYKSTFAEDISHSETNEEIFGVLSFVFWTLTLVPLFKYVFVVLRADDNGEGGTFALYSLLCRHANVSLLPNRQVSDELISTYKRDHPPEAKNNSKLKVLLEKHKNLHTALLILVLVGTCMVIGDGVLTPAISVFSAVSGLELSMSKEQHQWVTSIELNSVEVEKEGVDQELQELPVIMGNEIEQQQGPSLSSQKDKRSTQDIPSVCYGCRGSNHMLHINMSICATTLWNTSAWFHFCTSCADLASVHQCPWLVQHNSLESACLSSSFTILHVQVLEENSERWLDVFGWNSIVHNRLRSNVCGSWPLLIHCHPARIYSLFKMQIAFTFLVYPALILAYMGQAAYLSKHHQLESSYKVGFYVSVPESVRWPVLVIAILASVVGSQAIISGTFSIINQSLSLGCFPRVKVVHTSDKIHGQIYIPEINWMLMILCIAVAVGFRDTKHMGNASGLAVMTVMLVTTCLTSLVIVVCWHKPPILALAFLLFFGSIEALYFSASLIKFLDGAWLPLLLALILMAIMFVWHYATIKKYEFDLHNKVSLEWLLALGPSLGVVRVPGIGLVYTDLTSGIPANFSRFVTNLPAFHQVLVFVCVKSVTVPFVTPAERYEVGRVGPASHRSYRCIVRYGYRDVHQDIDSFETELVEILAQFIQVGGSHPFDDINTNSCIEGDRSWSDGSPDECRVAVIGAMAYKIGDSVQPASVSVRFETVDSVEMMKPTTGATARKVRFDIDDDEEFKTKGTLVNQELEDLWAAQQAGTAFILGHSHVKAKQGSSLFKRAAIDIGYNFLRRNCRGPDVVLRVPPASLLEVGMVYIV